MSAFATLFSGPLAHAIGWGLVHLLWQGVLVAAILAAALALMQRQSANARYLAACVALVLLLALGAGTAVHVYEPAVPIESAATTLSPEGGLEPVLHSAAVQIISSITESPATWRDALARFCASLQHFAAAAGQSSKYDAALTRRYLTLIHQRMEDAQEWTAFMEANPDLLLWRRPETVGHI